jgi:hypothetical protein
LQVLGHGAETGASLRGLCVRVRGKGEEHRDQGASREVHRLRVSDDQGFGDTSFGGGIDTPPPVFAQSLLKRRLSSGPVAQNPVNTWLRCKVLIPGILPVRSPRLFLSYFQFNKLEVINRQRGCGLECAGYAKVGLDRIFAGNFLDEYGRRA